MFNSQYDKIIDTLTSMDSNLKQNYKSFENKCPFDFVSKCSKGKSFNYIGDNSKFVADYSFSNTNEDSGFKLEAVLKNQNIKVSVELGLLNEEELFNVNSFSSQDGEYEFGAISFKKATGEKVEYVATLNKKDDGYYVSLKTIKYSDNKLIAGKMIEKKIDIDLVANTCQSVCK